jgi:hypothetical protein
VAPRNLLLSVPSFVQPDETSCGPTCLASLLEFHGEHDLLPDLLRSVPRLREGGTLGAFLGREALRRGYRARIFAYGPSVMDPTWFRLSRRVLAKRLRARASGRVPAKLRTALVALAEFVEAGGEVPWRELTPALLVSILRRGRPILAGLSATYLYRTPRERSRDNVPDALHGEPVGHFVLVCGYRGGGRSFVVRDPLATAPLARDGGYSVAAERLVNSILLGEGTYDDLLLEVWPRSPRRRS